MRVDVVTIFPDYLAPLNLSLAGKAQESGLLEVHVHDLRTWTDDRHRTVDDTPFGGGAGMVMAPEPWGRALADVTALPGDDGKAADLSSGPRVLVPTPSGRVLTQAMAADLATEPWLVIACGRYEGIDQRVLDLAAESYRTDEVSIGDYVLGGGEAAALVILESVIRLLPGVVGNPESLVEESHIDGLLEYPVYTRPRVWRDRAVPDVLLSGDHGAIARWRRSAALRRTAERRPDLLERLAPGELTDEDLAVLAEVGWAADDTGRLHRADFVG
jgi:tRNA (guanine37-N1)-methyltransferase